MYVIEDVITLTIGISDIEYPHSYWTLAPKPRSGESPPIKATGHATETQSTCACTMQSACREGMIRSTLLQERFNIVNRTVNIDTII